MTDLIPNITTTELLGNVTGIAGAAAAEILAIYDTDFRVDNKDDRSPLTAADMASHKLICRRLAEIDASVPVLSEESANIPYSTRSGWDTYWLVDPLDGTREFVKRNGEFTVNIALISANKPVLGVVHVPVGGRCYFAAAGAGAHVSDGGKTTPLAVKQTVAGEFIIAGSRSHGSDRQNAFIEKLPGKVEMIAIGSSLKFCLVAEGKVDLYPRFGPTSEWDTAAAQCVVEQAGGLVTDLAFEPLRYNTRESLLNPEFLVIADPTFDWKPYL